MLLGIGCSSCRGSERDLIRSNANRWIRPAPPATLQFNVPMVLWFAGSTWQRVVVAYYTIRPWFDGFRGSGPLHK
jgi:hypothetical protein